MTGRTRLASVLRLAAARWSAERAAGLDAPSAAVVHSTYRRAVRAAWRDPVEVADLALDGSDLEKLGLRGPAIGNTLRNLLETVITDPSMNTRETLLALARDAAGSNGSPAA
jgi:tRNA nucleotidyltransferase (CCA-adding enzyme)